MGDMAVWLMADPLVMFTSEPVRIEEIRARHGQRAIEVFFFWKGLGLSYACGQGEWT